jgi:hypothetical protein
MAISGVSGMQIALKTVGFPLCSKIHSRNQIRPRTETMVPEIHEKYL